MNRVSGIVGVEVRWVGGVGEECIRVVRQARKKQECGQKNCLKQKTTRRWH